MSNTNQSPNIDALKAEVEGSVQSLNISAGNLTQASASSKPIYTVTTGIFGEPYIAVTFADYVPPPPSDNTDHRRSD